jgi:AcrR family transcriptional regulator
MTSTHPSLRERQQVATKREIVAAAFDLFEKQGFGHTTIEEISQAAGVSARTVFRHFETKHDLVLGWLPRLEAIVAEIPLPELTLVSAVPLLEQVIEDLLVEYVQTDTERAAMFLRFRRLVQDNPDLQATNAVWRVRVTSLARDRLREHLGGNVSDLDIHLILQLLAAPLVAAAETWTPSLDSDLRTLYQAAKARRSELLGHSDVRDSTSR